MTGHLWRCSDSSLAKSLNKDKFITFRAILGTLEDLEGDNLYEDNKLNKQQLQTKVRESDRTNNLDYEDNDIPKIEKERLRK